MGGGNVLLALVRLRNDSPARQAPLAACTVFPSVGGSVEGLELHYNADGPRIARRRANSSFDTPSRRWAAARNPATGEVLALVSAANGEIVAMDWGLEGVALALRAPVSLPPGATCEAACCLVLAPDLVSARVYEALRYEP